MRLPIVIRRRRSQRRRVGKLHWIRDRFMLINGQVLEAHRRKDDDAFQRLSWEQMLLFKKAYHVRHDEWPKRRRP